MPKLKISRSTNSHVPSTRTQRRDVASQFNRLNDEINTTVETHQSQKHPLNSEIDNTATNLPLILETNNGFNNLLNIITNEVPQNIEPIIEPYTFLSLINSTFNITSPQFQQCDNVNFNPESLAEWALKENISHSSLNKLLLLLKTHDCFNHFPKDARTLLRTPISINAIRIVEPGKYFHFGLLENIKLFINITENIT